MKNLKRFAYLIAAYVCLMSGRAQDTTPAVQSNGLPEGVSLPKSGMVYALDSKEKHASLLQLHPTEIVSNSHAAGNLARSMVYVGARSGIELPGLNAAVNLADDHSVFYVRINSDDPELMRRRIHMIRLDQTKDRRLVSVFSQNVFGGQRSRKYNDIAIRKTDAEADVWLKITPEAPLPPGEYGIIFMPNDPIFAPDVVYDFDVAVDRAKPEKK